MERIRPVMMPTTRQCGVRPFTAGRHIAVRRAWAVIWALVLPALAQGCAFAADAAPAKAPALAPGWNRIATGDGTGCIDGGEYAFYVRPGSPKKLAIVLWGGGPCWSGATCDTCEDQGDRHRIASTLPNPGGLLDFTDHRNPIRDYTVVFIPNCTRDVLLGFRVVAYPAAPTNCRPDSVLSIRHIGSANTFAVLDWVFAHLPEPRVAFVTGLSAGAISSPFYTVHVARHFPHARVVQLGDAAGGYVPGTYSQMLKVWGALDVLRDRWGAEVSADSTPWSAEKGYVTAARLAPKATFAQINCANDEGQAGYLKLLGIDEPVTKIMAGNLALLHREIGRRFKSYTLTGTIHSITRGPEFYEAEEGGVKLRDWVAALLDNKKVSDVGNGLLVTAK
jgi:hypothetical protein